MEARKVSKPDFAGVVTGDWHLDRFNRIDDFARCVDGDDFTEDRVVFCFRFCTAARREKQ